MQDKEAKQVPTFGNIDALVKRVPNKYLLVNAARVRAQQITGGTQPLVDGANPEKAVSSAFQEIAADKLDITTESGPL